MLTITNSTNYINFIDGDKQVAIRKTAIGPIVLNKARISIHSINDDKPSLEFAHADVELPVTADITNLYTTILGYL